MDDRPLVLWTTPRSVSTAFDKMMRERRDCTVLTEPFSVPYYLGPERRSHRFGLEAPDATFAATLDAVVSTPGPVFIKEMAYHLGPLLDPDVVPRFRHSFLIRDPRRALPSLHRRWPDFTDDEEGYHHLHRLFELVVRTDSAVPPVIDADDLLRDPDAVVAAWCRASGLPHRPETLEWQPGMPDDWLRWADWFAGAAASSGFAPYRADLPDAADPGLAAHIARADPHYRALHDHRLPR